MLIAGLPGWMSPKSSRSRTNGERERESGARTGNEVSSGRVSWRVILYIMNSGTARRVGDDIA
jgi:hypothetical protein